VELKLTCFTINVTHGLSGWALLIFSSSVTIVSALEVDRHLLNLASFGEKSSPLLTTTDRRFSFGEKSSSLLLIERRTRGSLTSLCSLAESDCASDIFSEILKSFKDSTIEKQKGYRECVKLCRSYQKFVSWQL